VIGDGGRTFTPGDAADLAAKLAHLLANPAEGRAMAARGAARVAREHTPEAVGTRVEAAYGIALHARR
jgi:glycosyltransferase involved in cell wall biosynthesis